MKVKFENCEVELWKVKQGVVVMKNCDACHVVSIGTVWQRSGETVVNIQTKGMTDVYLSGTSHISDELTWIEPH